MQRRTRATTLLLLAMAMTAWAATRILSVQVRQGKLRERPSFLGRVTAEVAYGDRVTVLQEKGAWLQVRDEAGHTGWIHGTALTEKRIKIAAGDRDVETGASGEELALAGKGFNADVEAEFKAENPDVDFAWVDRMERFVVTPEQAVAFLREGDVKGGEQ